MSPILFRTKGAFALRGHGLLPRDGRPWMSPTCSFYPSSFSGTTASLARTRGWPLRTAPAGPPPPVAFRSAIAVCGSCGSPPWPLSSRRWGRRAGLGHVGRGPPRTADVGTITALVQSVRIRMDFKCWCGPSRKTWRHGPGTPTRFLRPVPRLRRGLARESPRPLFCSRGDGDGPGCLVSFSRLRHTREP